MDEENIKTEQLSLDIDSIEDVPKKSIDEIIIESENKNSIKKKDISQEKKPKLSKYEKRKLKIKKQNDLLNLRGISKVWTTFLVEFAFIFLVEMVSKVILGMFSVDWAILRIALSSAILAFISTLITTILPLTVRRVLLLAFDFLVVFYAWLQMGFVNFLGTFMSLGNAEQGTKITDYIFEFLCAYPWFYHLIWLLFISLVLYIVFERNITRDGFSKKISFKEPLYDFAGILFLAILAFMYYVTLEAPMMQNKFQTVANKELFRYPSNPSIAIKNFGTTVYLGLDIKSIVTGADRTYTDVPDDKPKEEEPETDYTRVIDDTAWEYLIKIENDKTLNNLNNYFINREITDKNDYTGLFEGKNLIMIMLESISEPLFKEEFKEYFPTFYKLYSEGITAINNYSPRNNCGTGESERTSQTSLYSIETTCTVNTYKDNDYQEALLYMLRKNGYYTSAYHDYDNHYYARNIFEYKFGAIQYFNANDLGIKLNSLYKEWPSDLEFMKKALPKFIDKDKFASYMITVSAHTPYIFSSEMGNKHLDLFKDTDYDITVKRYLSKVKEADLALEYLLDTLEENGILDDTVIVVFGDHYPYALSDKNYQSLADFDISVDNEVDRTPFIIYNSEATPEKIEKYTTPMDYAPTLLNLFGIEYDPRYYLGNDIFSDYTDYVLFPDNSWQNARGFYSSNKGQFIPKEGAEPITDEEIIAINKEASEARDMSGLAIKKNYFDYLFKFFDDYEKEQSKKNDDDGEVTKDDETEENG